MRHNGEVNIMKNVLVTNVVVVVPLGVRKVRCDLSNSFVERLKIILRMSITCYYMYMTTSTHIIIYGY